MNDEPKVPDVPTSQILPVPASPVLKPAPKRLYDWLRRFLTCNPCYLVSAALLLYSLYLISADPSFLRTEAAQLSFNLVSLQVYEALVIATAIFLAGRTVWYDSTLLVGLENLLLLVPFILISQAALIDPRLVWVLCSAGALLAATRLSILKRFIAQLNFPPRLFGVGIVLLLVNAALPVVYRVLHESKFGTKPDWGAAYQTNQYIWWLLLPALCALANVLPRAHEAGHLWPQRRWLPLGVLFLWLLGTGVHCYCLGYIYDFNLRPELLAPAVWMLLWVLYLRMADFLPRLSPAWNNALWTLPLLATLLATAQPGKEVFLALTGLNVAIYGFIYVRTGRPVGVLNLLLISLVAVIAGMPEDWGRSLTGEFSRENAVFAGAAIYLLLCVALSPSPKMGFLGALVSAMVVVVLRQNPDTIHWAAQTGLAFLLAHSLRWIDSKEEGATALRWIASLAWVTHAVIWAHLGEAGWVACIIALFVIGAFLASRWLSGRWGPVVVPLAALLVLCSGPGHFAAVQLQSAPAGLLALVASFLLFGLGTLTALTKHRWSS
jgi:hypothetical protein